MEIVLGDNVQGTVTDEGLLTLTVDLTKRLGPSKSGKTTMIATTSGPRPVGLTFDGTAVNVNIYTKR